MTFAELEQKLGESLNQSDWHQHPNGGGWVENSAYVESTSFVGSFAVVSKLARVTHSARILNHAHVTHKAKVAAVVSGHASIFDNAIISGNVLVGDSAKISEDVYIWGDAKILGTSKVKNYARIGDKVIIKDATIEDYCCIYGDAQINGNSVLSGRYRIAQGIWNNTIPPQIIGPSYIMNIIGYGLINIGSGFDQDVDTYAGWNMKCHTTHPKQIKDRFRLDTLKKETGFLNNLKSMYDWMKTEGCQFRVKSSYVDRMFDDTENLYSRFIQSSNASASASIVPGTVVNQSPTTTQSCQHEYVNMGFSSIKMVCKKCGDEKK